MSPVDKDTVGFGFSLLLGALGGAICGAAILSFGALIGQSGDTGAEYVGYWEPSIIWLGFLYGGLVGTIVAPIAYLMLVREIGFRRAFLPATGGALVGGFFGAILGPPLAVLTGVAGFFFAVYWAARHRSEDNAS